MFSVFRYGIAALALFERGWLFSHEQPKMSIEEAAAAVPALSIKPTAEDELAWLEYLAKRRPGMTKPGVTIRQEHEAWLRARHERRMRERAVMCAQNLSDEQVAGDDAVALS